MFRTFVGLLVVFFVSGCGCGGINRPSTSDFVIAGGVSQASGLGAEPLSGAEIRASVDRNKNGKVEPDEVVTATSDDLGKYRLQLKVSAGERVVVRFSGEGLAPVFKAVSAAPWAELPMNATLRQLDPLDCDSATRECSLDGSRLTLKGLADGASGSARVFNPEKETSAFPGGFSDRSGNLLISGVFGAMQLEDSSGQPIETLETPAELGIRVPRETWDVIVDLAPGDDRIQIPLYSFDEAAGEWVREGDGYLETGAGVMVPESDLPAIRARSYSGVLMARGSVSHFSYWNIDWPVSTKQCVTGVVLADDGKPAEGATVLVGGVTYTGYSSPQTVGADGRFCVEVMRSEAPGESVDNDETLGETQKVRIRIGYGGKLYDAGEHEVPSTNATCGSGGCKDLGDVQLSTDKEITPKICKVKGRVLTGTDQPLEGVAVFFTDPSVPEELRNELCGFLSINCTLISLSGADGSYEVSMPVLDGATLVGFSNATDEASGISWLRIGFAETDGCPSESATTDLVMTDGFATLNLTVSVTGQQLSWTPTRPLSSLIVSTSSGELKWMVSATAEPGFSGPITYGTVPAGAEQITPSTGAPPPLASGDTVMVNLVSELEGSPLVGAGTFTVP